MPTEPFRVTSTYATAGQAGTSLHTMAVLQVYQADLLRALDHGKGLGPEEVQVLCRNLTGIKEKAFFLYAPISPSGLFGDAVNTIVNRYQEAK